MKINKKKLFRWVKAIVIVYCLLGIALYYLQEKFLFHPEKLNSHYVFGFSQPFEEVSIPFDATDTMSMIKFFPADSLRRGVVIYFHGNRSNVERYSDNAVHFTKHGYEVWMPDYPGFGKSTGILTEEKLYKQALQVQKMAASKYGPDSIILYGKSLGTGIAAYTASQSAAKQLILETPYYSIPAIFGSYAFIFPVNRIISYKIPTYRFLDEVTEPVTILYGSSDWVVPNRCTERLKPHLKAGDRFIKIDGTHNTVNTAPEYFRVLDSLLR